MVITTFEAILDRALSGDDISLAEGVVLLKQTDPEAIAAIHNTADQLRSLQAGDTVTYVINRNINFTNICEQHCSFCAFRRDDGDDGAYWLDWAQILEKATDGVRRGATEICMQGGLNPKLKSTVNLCLIISSWCQLSSRNFPMYICTLSRLKKCNLSPEWMDSIMLM